MGKRLLTSQIALRSIAGRRANKSFSKSRNRIADSIVDWFAIIDSWELETHSLDKDGFRLRLFISCFISEKEET